MWHPVTCSHLSATAFCSAIPPATVTFNWLEIFVRKIRIVEHGIKQRIQAGKQGNFILSNSLITEGMSLAFVTSTVLAPQCHHCQAVDCEGKDVIHGQWC